MLRWPLTPTLSPHAGRGRRKKRRGYRTRGAVTLATSSLRYAYFAPGLSVCGVAGRAGAAPVVVPASLLALLLLVLGVTSRMPGGAAGLAGWVCAVRAPW